MSYEPSLEILEVNYSCSPGGIDMFEIYDRLDDDTKINVKLAKNIFETDLIANISLVTQFS